MLMGFLMLSLTGCALNTNLGSGNADTGIETSLNCIGWKPIITHPDDFLTLRTKRSIATHNKFGEAKGCWKPMYPRP